MATLTVEVDEGLLGRAQLSAERRGSSVQEAVLERIEELADEPLDEQRAAVERMLARAAANPCYGTGGIPSRDELNER